MDRLVFSDLIFLSLIAHAIRALFQSANEVAKFVIPISHGYAAMQDTDTFCRIFLS